MILNNPNKIGHTKAEIKLFNMIARMTKKLNSERKHKDLKDKEIRYSLSKEIVESETLLLSYENIFELNKI